MKGTGIVRRVDELGRIVLPKETRKSLNIEDGTALEIFVESDCICLRRYYPSCDFCENTQGDVRIGNKNICPECLRQLKSAFVEQEVKNNE